MDVSRSAQIRLTIGVGASAGGLAALKTFVRSLPTGAGFAVVVIQHLDPDSRSMLSELLDKHSVLPVLAAKDGQRLEADTVYVIPPDCYLSLNNGVIRLSQPKARRGLRKTVDHFFVSLAENCGARCAAIVMSGTGSDGTEGLAAVKVNGGLTIAQEPSSAEHASMPTSAIGAAVIDAVVPIEQMSELLENFVKSSYSKAAFESSISAEVAGENLAGIVDILRERENFDLGKYKPRTMQRRITRRMNLTGTSTYAAYLELLKNDAEERSALTKDLLINVTDFFRDPEAFQILESEILPAVLAGASDDRPIRVWVPGCASGEEAYSIAMIFLEVLETTGARSGIRIFATDIDEHAIDIARRGLFAESIAARVPAPFLDKYFARQPDGGPYRIAPAVRDLVSFAVQDVVSDPPFNHIDLISCRNLLIYLRKEVQEKVLRSFYFALEGDGCLVLGGSETIGGLTDLFTPVSRKSRVYRKIPGKDKRGQVLRSVSAVRARLPVRHGSATRPARKRGSRRDSGIERSLLDAFLPPGVVVDADGRILYNYGDWKAYMAIPSGEPRNEILRLVLPQLRTRIRTALYKARKDLAPVSFTCFVTLNGEASAQRQVRIEVAPLALANDDETTAFGIVFHELTGPRAPQPDRGRNDVRHANELLEQELSETREELQNTIEELETSTEELKASNEEALSANEELQSANEELEASAEELRSLNDELVMVNMRLKEKIEELQAAHDDVANFFSSTNIPTIFLNPDLQIERYTPAAEQLLKLNPSDVGRSVETLEGRLVAAGLVEDCHRVLTELHPHKDEIRAENGRWYVRHITPYRTEDRRIDGVVVVFQDVTDLKRLSRRAASRELQQSVVANLGLLSLEGVAADELIEQAVRRVAEVLQVDLCKVLRYRPETNDLLVVAGVGLDPGVVGRATVAADERSQAGYTLMSQGPVIVDRLSDERRFTGTNLLVNHHATSGMSCLIRHSDPPYGVLAVHCREYRKFTQDDVNFIVSVANLLSSTLHAQEVTSKLRTSEEQFRTMANSIPQLAWITDATGYIVWYNDQWFAYTGTTMEQMRGWGWQAVHHPDHVERVVDRFRKFIESGSEQWEDTFPLRGRNGEYRWFLSRAKPIRNEDGEVVRWFGTNTDVTEQRRQEKALRASEEKLRLAMNTNAIGTFEYYPIEDTVKWDELLYRVWGIADNETVSMQAFWEGLHPDDVQNVTEAIAEATSPAGDGRYYVIYRVINRQSGEMRWIEATGQTLFEDGKPTRMVGMVIDITDRKELEESLTKAVDELQAADVRKNEFLAVLGHELRNPLAALSNSVDMLGLMPTAVDDVLGIMHNSVRTMGRLLDDLLDLNRISQDKIQLDLQVVNLATAIRKATDTAAAECAKRHQKLVIELDDRLFVVGDATRLEQIFTNLLTNACKYTPEGGRIRVRAERVGDEIIVEVQDTGIGIEAGDLQRIFDPFFQVRTGDATTSGLGIGLALSKKLAELHGGTIVAVSEGKNRGTTFVVRFPREPDAVDADDPEHSGAWPVLPGSLSIVLIDDNEDILRTLPGLLESLNCDVRTARTAEYGLELVRSTLPDAVLVDIGLPDMSGHEVARRLRADGFDGLLVAVSGYGHREARERSTEVGFDHHLAKPAKLKEIASALAQARRK